MNNLAKGLARIAKETCASLFIALVKVAAEEKYKDFLHLDIVVIDGKVWRTSKTFGRVGIDSKRPLYRVRNQCQDNVRLQIGIPKEDETVCLVLVPLPSFFKEFGFANAVNSIKNDWLGSTLGPDGKPAFMYKLLG